MHENNKNHNDLTEQLIFSGQLKNRFPNCLPDFIIGGAMKSGTTTIHHVLAGSEKIYIQPNEIEFFAIDDLIQHPDFFIDDKTRFDIHSFPSQPVKYTKKYMTFFQDAQPHQLIGEDSTSYLASATAPQRIRQILPDVKLIFTLRDPASRAYSHYWHFLRTGRVSHSFENAIRLEEQTMIQRSRYRPQLENYLRHFPGEQIHIVIFEQFIAEPKTCLQKIFEFLNVEMNLSPDQYLRRCNPARIQKFHNIQMIKNRIFRKAALQKHVNYPLLTDSPRQKQKPSLLEKLSLAINPIVEKKLPPMNPKTRTILNEYFRTINKGLDELCNIDTAKFWYKDK